MDSDAFYLASGHPLHATTSDGRTADLRPLCAYPSCLRSSPPPPLHLAGAPRTGLQVGPLSRACLSRSCPYAQSPGRSPDHLAVVDYRLGCLLLARPSPLCTTLVHPTTARRTARDLSYPLVRGRSRRLSAPLSDHGRRAPSGCRQTGRCLPA